MCNKQLKFRKPLNLQLFVLLLELIDRDLTRGMWFVYNGNVYKEN